MWDLMVVMCQGIVSFRTDDIDRLNDDLSETGTGSSRLKLDEKERDEME